MYEDLIEQAEILATLDARRPRQANLRRAISSAYYALFHYLVEEACRAQMGAQHSQQGFRFALARAFTHTTMKQACNSFAGGTLKNSVIKGLPRDSFGNYAIPKPIQDIAATFVDLQDLRQLADYDRRERFQRFDVLVLATEVKNHVTQFAALPWSDDKKFFLACLWAWKELSTR